jgi:hypothetical protein
MGLKAFAGAPALGDVCGEFDLTDFDEPTEPILISM